MNKKAAVIVTAFILIFLFLAAILAISEHIPFIGKILSGFIALVIVAVVILFFVIILKRRK